MSSTHLTPDQIRFTELIKQFANGDIMACVGIADVMCDMDHPKAGEALEISQRVVNEESPMKMFMYRQEFINLLMRVE